VQEDEKEKTNKESGKRRENGLKAGAREWENSGVLPSSDSARGDRMSGRGRGRERERRRRGKKRT